MKPDSYFKVEFSRLMSRPGESAKRLSAILNVPLKTVQDCEHGILPDVETLRKIASYFGISTGSFFGKSPNETDDLETRLRAWTAISKREHSYLAEQLRQVVSVNQK